MPLFSRRTDENLQSQWCTQATHIKTNSKKVNCWLVNVPSTISTRVNSYWPCHHPTSKIQIQDPIVSQPYNQEGETYRIYHKKRLKTKFPGLLLHTKLLNWLFFVVNNFVLKKDTN